MARHCQEPIVDLTCRMLADTKRQQTSTSVPARLRQLHLALVPTRVTLKFNFPESQVNLPPALHPKQCSKSHCIFQWLLNSECTHSQITITSVGPFALGLPLGLPQYIPLPILHNSHKGFATQGELIENGEYGEEAEFVAEI